MNIECLKNLSIDQVDCVYFGRSGCMCGCRGKYREGKSSIRILNNMIKYAEEMGLAVEFDEEEGCYFVDDDHKKYVIYLKKDDHE